MSDDIPKLNLPKHHPASRDELKDYAAEYVVKQEKVKRSSIHRNACWLCTKSFQSRDDLKSHLKRIHGVELDL